LRANWRRGGRGHGGNGWRAGPIGFVEENVTSQARREARKRLTAASFSDANSQVVAVNSLAFTGPVLPDCWRIYTCAGSCWVFASPAQDHEVVRVGHDARAETSLKPELLPSTVVALQAQGQATQGRSLSTLAPLRALRARTPVSGDTLSVLLRQPDAGNLHVRFDERDVETESGSNQ
jgi:hypothetical protein